MTLYAGAVPNPYLHSYWKMNADGGTNEPNVIQVSGYNLSNNGSVGSAAGKLGNARGPFSGADFLNWSGDIGIYGQQAYIYEAWIKCSNNGSYQCFGARQYMSYGWELLVDPSGNIDLWQSGGSLLSSEVNCGDNNWHYIAAGQIATSGANNNRIYIDGVNRAQREGYAWSPTSTVFMIGLNGDANYPFTGYIDDVAYWDTVPAAWDTIEAIIAARWNGGRGVVYGPPVGGFFNFL